MTSFKKDLVFKTKTDKAEMTTSVARTIVEDEIKQREAKTARLKKLRLQREADNAEPVRPPEVKGRARRKV